MQTEVKGKRWSTTGKTDWDVVGGETNASSIVYVEPLDLATELAWPFPRESDARLESLEPTGITYSERAKRCLRHHLARAQEFNSTTTTPEDIAWVDELIAEAQDALDEPFEPCFLMEDYKEGNLVVTQHGKRWQVSGVFDLMGAHFGDGEADLSRQIASYLDEDAFPSHAHDMRDEFAEEFISLSCLKRLLRAMILWKPFRTHTFASSERRRF